MIPPSQPLAAIETRSEELQRYVRFDKADAQLLAGFASRAAPHFRGLAKRFYERILEHEQAYAVFTGGDPQILSVQNALVEWLEGIFGGAYDEDYFRKTNEIGCAHVRIGLPQRYLLAAMALLRTHLLDIIEDEAVDSAERRAIRSALTRLLDVELAIMLESYHRDLLERVERADALGRSAAVGALAEGLAHEIRNPLNGARLHLSFLKRTLSAEGGQGGAGKRSTAVEAESLEAVHVIDAEVRRLARLVSDFLEFARPRPLAPLKTRVQSLLERVHNTVAAAAATASVAIDLVMPSRSLLLDADAERLEQALLNLTNNAIEALAGAGKGGRVSLRVHADLDRERVVVFEIEDDGPGIPKGAGRPSIFDAFVSTKPRGTGLGLAIVQRVVADHGGSIDVESRPGCTRFRVKLPIDWQQH